MPEIALQADLTYSANVNPVVPRYPPCRCTCDARAGYYGPCCPPPTLKRPRRSAQQHAAAPIAREQARAELRELGARWLAVYGHLPTSTELERDRPQAILEFARLTRGRVNGHYQTSEAFWLDIYNHGLCTKLDLTKAQSNYKRKISASNRRRAQQGTLTPPNFYKGKIGSQ